MWSSNYDGMAVKRFPVIVAGFSFTRPAFFFFFSALNSVAKLFKRRKALTTLLCIFHGFTPF